MGLKSKSENIVIWLFIFESDMKWGKKAMFSTFPFLDIDQKCKVEKKGCVRVNWILIFDKSSLGVIVHVKVQILARCLPWNHTPIWLQSYWTLELCCSTTLMDFLFILCSALLFFCLHYYIMVHQNTCCTVDYFCWNTFKMIVLTFIKCRQDIQQLINGTEISTVYFITFITKKK